MIACRHIIFAVRATVNCHGSVTAAAADDLFYPLLEYIRSSPLSFNRWYKIRHRDQDSPANPLSFSTAPLSGTASPRNVVPDSFLCLPVCLFSCLLSSFFFPLCGKTLNKWISAGAEFAELKQGSFFTIIQSSKENKHKNKTKANTKAKQKKTHKSNHSKLSKNVLGGEKNGRLVKS